MKAAENFVETSIEDNFDETLFVDFMKKVPIWQYYCITKQAYLEMSEKEKRERISKYYSDMKNRQSTSEFYSFFFLF